MRVPGLLKWSLNWLILFFAPGITGDPYVQSFLGHASVLQLYPLSKLTSGTAGKMLSTKRFHLGLHADKHVQQPA